MALYKLLEKIPEKCEEAYFSKSLVYNEDPYKEYDCKRYKRMIKKLLTEQASFSNDNFNEVRFNRDKVSASVKEDENCKMVKIEVSNGNEWERWGYKVKLHYRDSDSENSIRPIDNSYYDVDMEAWDKEYYDNYDGA